MIVLSAQAFYAGSVVYIQLRKNNCRYMRRIILIVFTISLLHNITSSQWYIQQSPVGSHLLDVEFINLNTGWACGDGGVVLKTTNGGNNWIQQVTGVTNKNLFGIHPVDSEYVYCVGWFQTILKSTNGGTNWQILRNGTFGNDPSFFEVFFLDRNRGWMLRNNYILRSTNGGLSFDSTNVVFSYLRDIYFKDILNGVLCGDGSLIMKSTDGGVTWNQVTIPIAMELPDFYKESFIGNTGWVVGRGSNTPPLGHLVWKTTDFGTTWDTIARVISNQPFDYSTYCVSFTSLNTGWCGGTFGQIFKTTNGGFNWVQQQMPSTNFRRSMWFYNDSIGWAVGGGGQIVRTTTGGQYLAIEHLSGEVLQRFELGQNYPNPFNSQTTIEFNLNEGMYYALEIFDVLGCKVNTLFSQYMNAGSYRINFDAADLSSGIYIYILKSEKTSITRKFALVK